MQFGVEMPKHLAENDKLVTVSLFFYYLFCVMFNYFFDYMQDLPRTFPGHPWLDTPEGHASLRRVLVGYSFRDSDVGYCQVSHDNLRACGCECIAMYLVLIIVVLSWIIL